MRKILALICVLSSSFAFAGETEVPGRGVAQASNSICTVVRNGAKNLAFKKTVNGPGDGEYATFESASDSGIVFYLRGGHGVVRLEAWERNKMLAASWLQTNGTAPGDALNLDIRSASGKATEAQCLNVLSVTGN